MGHMEIWYTTGDRFLVQVRDHRLMIDQPLDVGGDDIGPTPTELYVAGLASCVGFFAERFLRRHELPTEGVRIRVDYAMSEDRPARVASIDVRVIVPGRLTTKQLEALRAVVDRCTVHNSLRHPPEVRILVAEPDLVARGELIDSTAKG